MRQTIVYLFLLYLIFSLGLFAQTPDEVLSAYTSALASRSPERVAATFHSEARILPDDLPPIEGLEAITTYYNWMEKGKFNTTFLIHEVIVLGEVVHVETSQTVKVRADGGSGIESGEYKGQMLLKKEEGKWKIFRYIFNETEEEEEEAEAIEGDFAHVVYFWLKEPENKKTRADFSGALENFLEENEQILSYHLGTPAQTPRDIVDNSYTFCLIVTFQDRAAHDAYQVSASHQALLKFSRPFWEKVQVYDSVR